MNPNKQKFIELMSQAMGSAVMVTTTVDPKTRDMFKNLSAGALAKAWDILEANFKITIENKEEVAIPSAEETLKQFMKNKKAKK